MPGISLPFTLDVPSIAYHNRAFPLGVMKANIRNFDEWLCNKLIDCQYDCNEEKYNLFDSDIWDSNQNLTQTQSFHITPEIFNCSSFDVIGIFPAYVGTGLLCIWFE